MTNAALRGKPDAGNPHVRFDEGEVAPAATPRRGSLLYKKTSQRSLLFRQNVNRTEAEWVADSAVKVTGTVPSDSGDIGLEIARIYKITKKGAEAC